MLGPVAVYRGGAGCVCCFGEDTESITKEVYAVQDWQCGARKEIDKKIRAA